MSISAIPRDLKSHILNPWGPHESPRNNPKYPGHSCIFPSIVTDDKNQFAVASIDTRIHSPHDSVTHPKGTLDHTFWAPAVPIRVQKQPKIPPTQLHFF